MNYGKDRKEINGKGKDSGYFGEKLAKDMCGHKKKGY
jgi:hypothetical protein